MKVIVVSGLSGSGKSSALNLLEDEGFTCIDNLPASLLPTLLNEAEKHRIDKKCHFAIGIDARNIDHDLSQVAKALVQFAPDDVNCQIIYLSAQLETLIKRFSETRRRHPLSDAKTNLDQAIKKEADILKPLIQSADFHFDTTHLSLHDLRSLMKERIVGKDAQGTTLIFSSFGFKYGNPIDADLVFDVRCLPNPHWNPDLRSHTGKDNQVKTFLEEHDQVHQMYNDIYQFVEKWLPSYEQNNRSYLNVAIGCTGGKHRSVYLTERLGAAFNQQQRETLIKHRQLDNK